MTTNLFVIANVKQLRTGGSFRILLLFVQTFGVLTYSIQQFLTVFSFHNQVEFGTILEGLWNFGRGGVEPLLGTPLV